MQTNNVTIKEYFTVLKIIFAGMLFSQVIMLIVSLLIFNNAEPNYELNNIFEIVVTLLFVTSIAATYFISKQKMKSIYEKNNISEKLEEFRTLFILKFAILEMPSMLSVISYIFTGNKLFLIYSVIIILVFLVNYPSKERIASELNIASLELF